MTSTRRVLSTVTLVLTTMLIAPHTALAEPMVAANKLPGNAPAPVGFKHRSDNGVLTFSWSKTAAVRSYSLQRSWNKSFTSGVVTKRTTGTSMPFWTTTKGRTAYYRVRGWKDPKATKYARLDTKWSTIRTIKPARGTAVISAGTYNVCAYICTYTAKDDPKKRWDVRSKAIASALSKQGDDVVGFQELGYAGSQSTSHRNSLLKLVAGTYGRAATSSYGRSIFYRTSTITATYASGLPFPNGSVEFMPAGAKENRSVVYQVLRHKASGAYFVAASTHLQWDTDNANSDIRRQQADAAVAAVEKVAKGRPIVFVGDMNSHKGFDPNAPREEFLSEGFKDTLDSAVSKTNASYNSFFSSRNPQTRRGLHLDQVYVTGQWTAWKWGQLISRPGTEPSDHNYVWAASALAY